MFMVYEVFWKKCMSMLFELEVLLLLLRRLMGLIGMWMLGDG